MKKIFTTLFLLFAVASVSNAAFEVKHTINVGMDANGANANKFSPATVNCYVGDTIEYKWHSGTHFVGATSGPWPAQEPFLTQGYTFDQQHQTYIFVVPAAGNYNYSCFSHGQMTGIFNATVNPASVASTPYFSLDLKSYPNPAKENLTVAFNAGSSSKGEFRAYDIQGRAVISEELEIVAGTNTFVMPVGTLTTGLYFMEIYQDGKKLGLKKFVKE